jgi:hypothetical protein
MQGGVLLLSDEITERVFRYVCVGMCGMARPDEALRLRLHPRLVTVSLVNQLPIPITTMMVASSKKGIVDASLHVGYMHCTVPATSGRRLE